MANSLHNLGRLYFGQHRYAEAEPLYGRAVAIVEKNLWPKNPDLAQTLGSYALLLQRTKWKSEASTMTLAPRRS